MQGIRATGHISSDRATRPQRLAFMVGVGFLFVYLLSWSGIVQTPELATYYLRLWFRGTRSPPPSIVTVAINDKSFSLLDQNILGVNVAWMHPSPDSEDNERLARSHRHAGSAFLISVTKHQPGHGYEWDHDAVHLPLLAQAASGAGPVRIYRVLGLLDS